MGCPLCKREAHTPGFGGCDYGKAPGVKRDTAKPRWGLLPWRAVSLVVDVLTFGARKYAPDNWRYVDGWRWRYQDAALRHIAAWSLGEKNDSESGLPHLAHAICCLTFLLELDEDPKQLTEPPAKIGAGG